MEIDKTITAMIIIELVCAFCIGWFLNEKLHPDVQVVKEVRTEVITKINEVPVYVTKTIYAEPTYETLLKEAHSVNNEYWKCTNYSKFLLDNLRANGYNASMICGWNKSMTTGLWQDGHAWVELRLELDAINGYILQKKPEYDIYDFNCEEKYFK